MRNIIKAQFFQVTRDKFIKYTAVAILGLQILMVMLPVWLEVAEVSSAGELVAAKEGSIASFPVFFLILVTAQICGADFMDKTNHYELMGGHKRAEVYLGRVIPALLVAGLGAFLLVIFPVGLSVVLYGWGTKVAVSQALVRFGLLLFPLLRLVCEFACLTFLVKNPYVVMGVGYLVFMATTMLTGMMESRCMFLGVTNISWLMIVNKWMTYGLGNDTNYIFDASTPPVMLWGTIGASVFFGFAALFLGYVFFRNDDMS